MASMEEKVCPVHVTEHLDAAFQAAEDDCIWVENSSEFYFLFGIDSQVLTETLEDFLKAKDWQLTMYKSRKAMESLYWMMAAETWFEPSQVYDVNKEEAGVSSTPRTSVSKITDPSEIETPGQSSRTEQSIVRFVGVDMFNPLIFWESILMVLAGLGVW